MNIVFWLLIIFAAIGIWLLLRKLFYHIGNGISKQVDETKTILEQDEDKRKRRKDSE